MAHFGEELLKRSPSVFWALAPFLVAFALFLPATVELDSVLRVSVVAAAVLVSVLALLSLWPYSSLEWPRRALTALVFSVYVLYAIDEWSVITVGESGENRNRSLTQTSFRGYTPDVRHTKSVACIANVCLACQTFAWRTRNYPLAVSEK